VRLQAKAPSGRHRHSGSVVGWALASPGLLAIVLVALYPLVALLLLSFSQSSLGQPFRDWVGLENFRRALQDDVFRAALAKTVVFALVITVLETVLGLLLALLLQQVRRGGWLLRTLVLLPLMTPPVMLALAWRLVLAPSGGLLNRWLQGAGFIERPISFLGSPQLAFPSIAIADIWQWTPFVALLTFAALQLLPPEVDEAARLDGAGSGTRLWSITLPMLAPVLASIFLLRFIMAMKLFDLVYVLTFGGPGFTTTVASFYIYRVAFQHFNVGYAAAMTVLLGLTVGLVTLPVSRLRSIAQRLEGA